MVVLVVVDLETAQGQIQLVELEIRHQLLHHKEVMVELAVQEIIIQALVVGVLVQLVLMELEERQILKLGATEVTEQRLLFLAHLLRMLAAVAALLLMLQRIEVLVVLVVVDLVVVHREPQQVWQELLT
jgi:hypothetical protein